jgi:DNA repair exonuclease SbcCD ATPase subunit
MILGAQPAAHWGCVDNKFEIRFRTQRSKADRKGMVDDFDIEVRNKNLDRTCLVDELSGGQFVLVNEAVNLGIAIYNMRRGESIRYETLFRDETVGALDAVNGKGYVGMLMRFTSSLAVRWRAGTQGATSPVTPC